MKNKKYKKLTVFIIATFLSFSQLTVSYSREPVPRDPPVLPAKLSLKEIDVSDLRTRLYVPMYIDGQNSVGDHSHLEISNVFNGGQNAINSQVSVVRTIPEYDDQGNVINSNTRVCEGYDDVLCANRTKSASVILPVCTNVMESACVESFSIIRNGIEISGQEPRYVDNTFDDTQRMDWISQNASQAYLDQTRHTLQDSTSWIDLNQNRSRRLPDASSPTLWTVPEISNASGDVTYMVNARLSFIYNDAGSLFFEDFSAEVIPYKEISDSGFQPPFWVTRENFANAQAKNNINEAPESTESFPFSARYPLASFDNPEQGQEVTCAFEEIDLDIEKSKCGVAVRFTSGDVPKLTLRIPKELGGWFHGRLSDTEIGLTAFNDNLNRLTVTAKPVDVHITSYQFEACHPANSGLADLFSQDNLYFTLTEFCNRKDENDEPITNGLGDLGQWQPKSARAVEQFTNFTSIIDDQAKGVVNSWSIGSLPFDESLNACFSKLDEVQGFISTNAMVYQAGVPTYSNGKFNYRIASTHLDADANVIRGDYTLVVRTSVARCLWGFGNGDISGSIQVTGASNEEKSSSTTFSFSPDWIRITAIGFTFSESNVALTLSEKKNVAGSVKSTLTPTVGSKSRTTIANVAKLIGVEAPAKSRYFISISKESRKFCRFDNGRLLAVKAGNCTVTVTALAPKPKPVRLSGAIQNVESTTLTKQQLVEKLGRTWVPKSAVTISVSKSSRQACYVKAGKLFVKPNSNCEYRLVLSEPRPKPVKVTGTIQVN